MTDITRIRCRCTFRTVRHSTGPSSTIRAEFHEEGYSYKIG